MQQKILLLISALGLIASSSIVSASGSYGGGYNNTQTPTSRSVVDQDYEVGKAIFNGRQRGEPSLEYCIVVEGEKVPVKRRSVKSYKGKTYSELANNLYQCDEPEKLIADGLTRDSLLYVVYYLNKRHKLGLKS